MGTTNTIVGKFRIEVYSWVDQAWETIETKDTHHEGLEFFQECRDEYPDSKFRLTPAIYSYTDSEAGEQSEAFTSLSDLIRYIEQFPAKGGSEGIVKMNNAPILEYRSDEDGALTWVPCSG